jgi:hypothetical protein
VNALSILVPVLLLLGLGVVAAGAVFLVVKLRTGEPIEISFRLLLTVYFYVLTIASFIVLLLGLSGLVNAGLSTVLGRDFSYSRPPMMKPLPPPPEGGQARPVPSPEAQRSEQVRRQEIEFREGLLQGASMAIVGGVVWVLHNLGRLRMERREERRTSFFNKAYLIILLAICSLVGIFSLASGVYETLRFYLIQPVEGFGYRSPPGQTLSVAIVFVPAWGYYLLSLLRGLKQGDVAT